MRVVLPTQQTGDEQIKTVLLRHVFISFSVLKKLKKGR